jgi:hypothetical protein
MKTRDITHCKPTAHILFFSPKDLVPWHWPPWGGQASITSLGGPSLWYLAEDAITMANPHSSC